MTHIEANSLFASIDIIKVARAIHALDALFTEATQFQGASFFRPFILEWSKWRHIPQEIEPVAPLDTNHFSAKASQEAWPPGTRQ